MVTKETCVMFLENDLGFILEFETRKGQCVVGFALGPLPPPGIPQTIGVCSSASGRTRDEAHENLIRDLMGMFSGPQAAYVHRGCQSLV